MSGILSYEGKRVLVAGGGGTGMGAAAVKDLIQLGAEVHVVDLREPGEPVASYQQVDLTDATAIGPAVARIGGPIHSLFYCAGLPGPPFSGLEVMTVNWIAARCMTDAVTADLMPSGGAVCVTSSAAGMGWQLHMEPILELLQTVEFQEAQAWCEQHPDLVDEGYTFSKEALILWTMHASVLLAHQKRIRLNCVSPGPTDTPMWAQFVAILGEDVAETVPRPLGRNSTPEEQAHAMVFLNSDAASYVTGSNFVTDGGFTASLVTGQASFASFGVGVPE